jgi:hypothetical protein
LTTIDPSNYVVDLMSFNARITPIPGFIWPACYFRPNAVIISFTVGHQFTQTQVVPVVAGTPQTAQLVVPSSMPDSVITGITTVLDNDSNPVTGYSFDLDTNFLTLPAGTLAGDVTVTLTISSAPAHVLQAIKLITAAWYENREEWVTNMMSSSTSIASVPVGFLGLLNIDKSNVFGYTGGGH